MTQDSKLENVLINFTPHCVYSLHTVAPESVRKLKPLKMHDFIELYNNKSNQVTFENK